MAVKLKPYDSAEFLRTPAAIVAYLDEAMADNDPRMVAHALGVAARARGMSALAKATKLSRESLYRTLSEDGNPELQTVLKVLNELGVELTVRKARRKSSAGTASISRRSKRAA